MFLVLTLMWIFISYIFLILFVREGYDYLVYTKTRSYMVTFVRLAGLVVISFSWPIIAPVLLVYRDIEKINKKYLDDLVAEERRARSNTQVYRSIRDIRYGRMYSRTNL